MERQGIIHWMQKYVVVILLSLEKIGQLLYQQFVQDDPQTPNICLGRLRNLPVDLGRNVSFGAAERVSLSRLQTSPPEVAELGLA